MSISRDPNPVLCCSAIEGPADLDPRISNFVSWAKTEATSREDSAPFVGTLVGLQNKPFGIGLYRVENEPFDPNLGLTCIYSDRGPPFHVLHSQHTLLVPGQGEGERGGFVRITKDNSELHEWVLDFIGMKYVRNDYTVTVFDCVMHSWRYFLFFATNDEEYEGEDDREDGGRSNGGDEKGDKEEDQR